MGEAPSTGILGNNWSSQKIIQRNYRQIGIDWYAIVHITFWIDSTAPMDEFRQRMGIRATPEKKAIELFKYDPFNKYWNREVSDMTNLNDPFSTQNVQNTLMRLSPLGK